MKGFKILFLVAILVLGIVTTTFGDGVAFRGPDLDYSSMSPIKQGEQRAVIVHRNGVEKMLIAVSLELEDEDKGLWIFPVPSNPNTIKLDVLESFPVFEGVDTLGKVHNLFEDILKLAFLTQIYPTPFVIISNSTLSGGLSLGKRGGFKVSTYYEVEKWGVHTEAVRADSIEDLRGYLKEKGVGIETKELSAFEDYLSDKYVLILAWISSRKELLKEFKEYGKDITPGGKRWPSLYVEFTTEKAFYPMRPTSSYGEEYIKITLTILDYVQIDRYYPHIYTGYYRQSKAVKDIPSKMTKDLLSKNIRYTRISFADRARFLRDDLWFIPGAPNNVKNGDLIVSVLDNSFGFCIAYICIISFLSWITAGLTGLVLFQKWKGYARLGLWNIFTLIGLCAASYKVKGIVGERFSQTDRFPGRWTFNVLFSIFYLLITGYFSFNLILVLDYILF
jgi:hypothetical protein